MAVENMKTFDLSEYLPDSLSLQVNTTAAGRHLPHFTFKDPYSKFKTQENLLDILGERSFGKPTEICEATVGTPIQEFYRGLNVFITGGTGFLGKILTEKLIRSIPHISQLYILIRAKRNKTARERFEELLQDKIFSRMKTEVPHFLAKITVVPGDISEPGLGLSPADREMLLDRVHVVFHGAADVRFTEPIRHAINSNVLGSKRVLDLAKDMKHLVSYIHVSTAFSQCVNRVIKETVPVLSVSHNEIIAFVESKTDDQLAHETPRLLQGWINTYVFSKALCEQMIQEEYKALPVLIFRPSIVVSTYKEPVRGYIDNLYGPVGFLVGCGHGIVHCGLLAMENFTDLVPVDFTVNCMIAAAWHNSTNRTALEIDVYNFTTTYRNPILWKTLIEFSLENKDLWPFNRSIWYTSFLPAETQLAYEILHFLLHKIPGIFIDKLIKLTGGKPILSKIYERMYTLSRQTSYFATRFWEFENDNVEDLWRQLSLEDKRLFHFDLRDVDLKEHFFVSKLGFKFYFLKEEMESLPATNRRNARLCWIHKTLQAAFGFAVLKLLVITARALPI